MAFRAANALPAARVLSQIGGARFASIAKSTGGRCSNSGLTVTVFGSSGFLGRYVVNRFGRIGSRVVCAHRSDYYEVRHLKVMGDSGQIHPVSIDHRNKDDLYRLIEQSNVVVNLIGKTYETSNYSFDDCHIKIPTDIAQISAELGVDRLVHFSSIDASPDAHSLFAKTKYEGERAVQEAFPEATIFRPSKVFGFEDNFLNGYARLAKMFNYVPLVNGGMQKIQPVWVQDVADAVYNAIADDDTRGQTFDIAGPKTYSEKEIVDVVIQMIQQNPQVVEVPASIASYAGSFVEKLPFWLGGGLLTQDQIRQKLDNVIADPTALQLRSLGITPATLEDVSLSFIKQYRKGSHFLAIH